MPSTHRQPTEQDIDPDDYEASPSADYRTVYAAMGVPAPDGGVDDPDDDVSRGDHRV